MSQVSGPISNTTDESTTVCRGAKILVLMGSDTWRQAEAVEIDDGNSTGPGLLGAQIGRMNGEGEAEDEVRSAASVLLALMNQDAVERSRGHKRKYASGPDEWTSAICAKRTRIGTSQGEDDTDRGEEEVAIVAGPMRRPILKLRGPKQQVEDASDAGKASHKKAHPAAAKAPKRSRNWQTDGQFRRSFVVALDAAITASPSSSLPNSTSAPLSPPSSRTTSSGSENTSLLHRTPHGDEGVVTQPEVRTRVGRQSKKARKYGD